MSDFGDFVSDFIERHRLTGMTRYATYHALDWQTGKPDTEVRAEVARVTAKSSHTYQWNEVGNAQHDYTRRTVLTRVLTDREHGIDPIA